MTDMAVDAYREYTVTIVFTQTVSARSGEDAIERAEDRFNTTLELGAGEMDGVRVKDISW